jgi:hypothetical protein
MSELVLYDFGNSVCCQKVRVTLRAKGLDWRAIRVDLFKAEQYDPAYERAQPRSDHPRRHRRASRDHQARRGRREERGLASVGAGNHQAIAAYADGECLASRAAPEMI